MARSCGWAVGWALGWPDQIRLWRILSAMFPAKAGARMARGDFERFVRLSIQEDWRPFAWRRACVVRIGPPDQFSPTAPLLTHFSPGKCGPKTRIHTCLLIQCAAVLRRTAWMRLSMRVIGCLAESAFVSLRVSVFSLHARRFRVPITERAEGFIESQRPMRQLDKRAQHAASQIWGALERRYRRA
jgi:hypothetical protein